MFVKKNIFKGTINWFNNSKKFGVVRTEEEEFFFNSEEEFKTNDPVWVWELGTPIKEGKLPKGEVLYRLSDDIIFNINPDYYEGVSPYIFENEFPEGEYIKINKEIYKNLQTGETFRFIPEYKSKNNTPSLGERFLHGEKYLQEEQEKIAEEKRQKEIRREAERNRREEIMKKTKVVEDNLINFIKNEINKLPQREEIIYFVDEGYEDNKRFTSNPNPKIQGEKGWGQWCSIYSIEDEILNIEETNLFIENKILEFKSINSDIEGEILNRIDCPPIEDSDCPINQIILNGEAYPIKEL